MKIEVRYFLYPKKDMWYNGSLICPAYCPLGVDGLRLVDLERLILQKEICIPIHNGETKTFSINGFLVEKVVTVKSAKKKMKPDEVISKSTNKEGYWEDKSIPDKLLTGNWIYDRK